MPAIGELLSGCEKQQDRAGGGGKVERARAVIRGAVQGVGFRPFVFRLAGELGLCGWVLNCAQGVIIEAEGQGSTVRRFLLRLEKEKPPRAIIHSFEFSLLEPAGYRMFAIRESEEKGPKSVLILPDIATCGDCLREILDPGNRRFRYPFTNCTNCGPRYSIVTSLPYDRPNTTMQGFAMCPCCDREYHDPSDRRFHAQPTACPQCGPQLECWDAGGRVIGRRDDALLEAARRVRSGEILALKGLGGFQLIVDARNEEAVLRLRRRKHREEKPFAIMLPKLEAIVRICRVSALERRLLESAEAPIVLLERKPDGGIAGAVAPGNPFLGVMLPSTPLHHLLMREWDFAVVATSGNVSDEPICTGRNEAVERLQGIADSFLVHDRPIARRVDDSVVRIVAGQELVMRRARGYAPLPLHVSKPLPCVLALGAHLKNTVALSVGTEIFVSQHLGDLSNARAFSAFQDTVRDLPSLYDATPEIVACDLHPEYLSTKYAAGMPGAKCPVQHHWAHVLACMAENEVEAPALGVAWDGTGFGEGGTIWGGEFLRAGARGFDRVAHFRTFRLPGGEAAIREPRRAALGLLFEMDGSDGLESRVTDFQKNEIRLLKQMLARGLNAPLTSSAGRLFDAVASLIGLRQRVSFEGQAAMDLEAAISPAVDAAYPFSIKSGLPAIVDWEPMVREMLRDRKEGRAPGEMAAKFHNTLAEIVVAVAERVGDEAVLLTGGCFQNRYLTERSMALLRGAGFRPFIHQRIPPNDGGIAVGQIIAATRELAAAENS